MIPLHTYKGLRVGVFGLGRSGEATVQALLAGGAEVLAWDDTESSRERLAQCRFSGALTIENYELWDWAALSCLVLSPGVPLTHPVPHAVVRRAIEADCRIMGDIGLLREACPESRIVGITGTNGKSTTTALIGHILQQAARRAEVGGNLGTAALSLAPLHGADDTYVLELSSYQLDLLPQEARVQVALLLNLSPDHIDRHGDMTGYVTAKQRIFAGQQAQDVAIVSVDDPYCADIFRKLQLARGERVLAISVRQPVSRGIFVTDGVLHDVFEGGAPVEKLNMHELPGLRGVHNWQNAAAAYAACRACGLSSEEIIPHLRSFPGLRHRMQPVATLRGVSFVNDSKATNADAAERALAAYDEIYWIAGGQAKEGGITSLEPCFPNIRHAFLIGAATADFARTLEGKVAYTRCGTLEKALESAANKAFSEKRKGAVVLLSPACASFDQWRDFEQRGDAFCELVARMQAQEEDGSEKVEASG